MHIHVSVSIYTLLLESVVIWILITDLLLSELILLQIISSYCGNYVSM